MYRAIRQQEDAKKDIADKDKHLAEYSYIPSWERTVGQTEAVLADTRAKIAEIEKLKNLQAVWKDLSAKVTALEKIIDGLKSVDTGLELVGKAQKDAVREHSFIRMLVDHAQAVGGCGGARKRIAELSSMIQVLSPLVERLVDESAKNMALTLLSNLFESHRNSISALKKTTQSLAGIEKSDSHLREAWSQKLGRSALQSFFERYQQSSLAAMSLERVLATLGGIDGVENVLKQVQGDNTRRLLLQALYDQYEGPKLSALSLGLKVRNFPDVERAEERLKQAEDGSRKFGRLREACYNRSDSIQLVAHSKHLIDTARDSVNELESKYLDLMLTLGKCPTCGGDINIEKLREVI